MIKTAIFMLFLSPLPNNIRQDKAFVFYIMGSHDTLNKDIGTYCNKRIALSQILLIWPVVRYS